MTQLITNDDEVRQFDRKKLYELSLKRLGQKPKLEEPDEEQKQLVLHERKTNSIFDVSWRCQKIGDLSTCDCNSPNECLMNYFVHVSKKLEGV